MRKTIVIAVREYHAAVRSKAFVVTLVAMPMLMLLRQGIPPGVSIWQPILGIACVLLTIVLIVFAAGRIFRIGILLQGKGANFNEMLRWALRG